MEYFADTDIGKYREKNEDYLYAENNLFIVADGMGGHMAGEVASRIAVEAFIENFNSSLKGRSKKISANKKTDNPDPSQIEELLLKSIKSANREVYSKATLQPGYYGMGTTFTGCYIQQDKVYTIHVGDSRLYIKRGSEFNLLTSDHTIVGELFRRGEISYEQTFNHPQRNYLTNVLGVAKDIDPDFNSFKVLPEDILLLCSDGLNSMLKDEDIANIIDKYKDAKDIAKNLIKGAIKKSGLDNITVIVVKI
ncbi:MAG: Stp1/IreP family PP2C-type Ser/Thr phosphatase [Actinobacteria bacterium]|nr:Stp1/IreP family PP2C-type Ser/Thr phosphatase [Actinomycetota bacterium]